MHTLNISYRATYPQTEKYPATKLHNDKTNDKDMHWYKQYIILSCSYFSYGLFCSD